MTNKQENMKEQQVLRMPVRARHFNNAPYLDIHNCPIANAAKEFFNVLEDGVNEGVTALVITDARGTMAYSHVFYDEIEYSHGVLAAAKAQNEDEIIFELELKKGYEYNVW